ncbi:hypothetical protein DIPPA_09811 [Diplonema papillatum]|nr:hypothetical protein DIPPA_09811 [Diplonema papillatum]
MRVGLRLRVAGALCILYLVVAGFSTWAPTEPAYLDQPRSGASAVEVSHPAGSGERTVAKGRGYERTPVHLVVAHYNEEASWLYDGWGRQYSHTVYERARDPGTAVNFADGYTNRLEVTGHGERLHLMNFGDEGVAFLRFIIDNYDDLPDVTVFLHGSPERHNRNIGAWIGCLRTDIKGQPRFVFLTRRLVLNRCIVDNQNKSVLQKVKHGPRLGMDTDYGAFADYYLSFPWQLLDIELPRCLSFYCCAEFAATSAMIRSRSRQFYEHLWSHMIEFVIDRNNARRFHGYQATAVGGFYEHVWHLIYGEPVNMTAYGSRYCNYFKPSCAPCEAPSRGLFNT